MPFILDEPERLSYTPPGGAHAIYYRRPTAEIYEDLERKYRKTEWRRGQKLVEVPPELRPKLNSDVWDWIITGWDEGFAQNKDGAPMPCTREAKLTFYNLYPEDRDRILELATTNLRPEDAHPNSSGSSSTR